MSERVPAKPGLFAESADAPTLLGNRCKSCNRVFFPSSPFCYDCGSEEMETVPLGKDAKLYSYTIAHMPSPNYAAPYAFGWIELPEGVKTMSPLVEWENKPLKIGMKMELVIGKLWEEDDTEIIGYKFRPVS